MGDGEIKESGGGVNSNVTYLIHCKNFHKCHNVPIPSTTIKNKKEIEFLVKKGHKENFKPRWLH
jgi:hypothetical protein